MSRHPISAEPMCTLTIPKDSWSATSVHPNVLPAPGPCLPTLVRLLSVVALVSGYTPALAPSAHVGAVATALLLAFAGIVGLGCGAVRYAVALVRHHRSSSGL